MIGLSKNMNKRSNFNYNSPEYKKPPQIKKSSPNSLLNSSNNLFQNKNSLSVTQKSLVSQSHRNSRKMISTLKKKTKGTTSFKNLNSPSKLAMKYSSPQTEIKEKSFVFSIKNFNKDFVEEGIVRDIKRLSSSKFIMNLEIGKLVLYDLENCSKILQPIKISEKNILGLLVDIYSNIWVSTFKGLFVFDSNLKFITEVEKTRFGIKKLC